MDFIAKVKTHKYVDRCAPSIAKATVASEQMRGCQGQSRCAAPKAPLIPLFARKIGQPLQSTIFPECFYEF
jgi:hypothetical protein